MKNFLKMLLASILGVILASIIVFFIFVGIISALVTSSDTPVEIKPNAVLKLTLDKTIVERTSQNPLDNLNILGFGKDKEEGLTEIIADIKKAKDDDNIKGIYLELSIIQARISTVEEIRNALIDFKKSNKFIIAYGNILTQRAYYLASVADKIYLNPQGEIEFTGMHSEVMFFKGALEKLGIEPEIIRHGKFKSAVEPFMSDKMSEENRAQISQLIKTIWENNISAISSARNISTKELNYIADKMILTDADSCISRKIVDSLLYLDQVYSVLLKKSGNSAKEPEFITLNKYDKVVAKKSTSKSYSKNKIAVVYAQGDVVMGDEDEDYVSADRISKALRDARTDTSIKAIVFRINSPGGSSLASEIIWREVKLAAKVKPVVASMGDLAASGGYYIACAADTIIAQPTTITGSIGVFGVLFNAKQLLNQKLGITTDVVKTNEHSDFPTITRPMDGQEKKFIQMEIEKIYQTFVNHVAEGRKMGAKKVDDIGQGRVWSGIDALKLGLVDTLGGLNDAIAIAAKMAKLDNYRLLNLPKIEDPFDKIMKDLTGEAKAFFLKSELGDGYILYKQYKNMKNWNGIQTRLPFDIDIY
jgi:protease-4